MKLSIADALSAWRLSPVSSHPFPCECRPMLKEFSYEFANGFVDTGDLPCRESWKAKNCSQDTIPDNLFFPGIYAGDDVVNIDFSDFQPRPILTERYLRTYITVDDDQDIVFRIRTCGVLHLWCDGEPILDHQVRTRNVARTTSVNVTLSAGEHVLTVYLEELHERDTHCFFSILLSEGKGLSQSFFPQAEQILARNMEALLNAFKQLRTSLLVQPPTLSFQIAAPFQSDIAFRLVRIEPFGRGGLWDLMPEALPQPIDVVLRSGEHMTDVTLPGKLPGGSVLACIELCFEGYRIERTVGMVLQPSCVLIDDQRYSDRKQHVLQACEAHPGYDPSTAQVLMSSNSEAAIDALGRILTTVEVRQDCSDFNLLGLFWFVDHVDLLPASLVLRLENALLGYRYWLDEPGNDVMWFWSENHALCFHVAQALAGQSFSNRLFSASGQTGTIVQSIGESRLRLWFDAVERNGLAEYNSAAYYPIDLLGLLVLHDHTTDTDLKQRSAHLLDEIFAMMALHTLGGTPAGAQGRAYEKELLAGVGTELGSVVAAVFGGLFMPGFDRAVMLLCLSGYEPPDQLQRFATPAAGAEISARYCQGAGSDGHLCVYKNADVQLSSATGHIPGERGHQQHLVDVQFAASADARAWINHPGDSVVWGEQRPSYLAGNLCLPRVAQHLNQALMLYDLDKAWNPHRWINVFIQTQAIDVKQSDNWLFLHCGNGIAAIWCSATPELQQGGQGGGCVWHCAANNIALVIRIGCVNRLDEPGGFQRDCQAHTPEFDIDRNTVRTRFDGKSLALQYDGSFLVDDQVQVEQSNNVWPWISENGQELRYWREVFDTP